MGKNDWFELLWKKTWTLWPLFRDGFYCLKCNSVTSRQSTFYHSVFKISWYSFNRHGEDEKMSQSLSHPLGLNLGPLDLESSALSTRPLLYCSIMSPKSKVLKFSLSQFLGFFWNCVCKKIYLTDVEGSHKFHFAQSEVSEAFWSQYMERTGGPLLLLTFCTNS